MTDGRMDDYPPPEPLSGALSSVLGDVDWEVAALGRAFLLRENGADPETAGRVIYERSRRHTLTRSKEIVQDFPERHFLEYAKERTRTGSAENPVTKLFPAAITERRFVDRLEPLVAERPSLSFEDDRHERRGLSDFTLLEEPDELPLVDERHALPINVKTATTLFRKAEDLVGLEPEDCLPIPAYKAHGALEKLPDLIYVISPDWELLDILPDLLEDLLSAEERRVWAALNEYAGSGIRDAEDRFVFRTVETHWDRIRATVADNPFHAISAKKAIQILREKPKRTPGIGMRAWGTGASAEVNVHISISEDTVPWERVSDRIRRDGVRQLLADLRRTTHVEVHDPAF